MAPQRQLAAPAYLVGFALLCIPPFDALMQVLPFKFGEAKWRFGAFGLLSNALMIPLTGLLVIFLVSAIFEHRLLQKVLGVLSILAALGVAALLMLFALDAVQVRGLVNPAAVLAFKVASATAGLKACLAILTLAAFGWAGLRARKVTRTATSSRAGSLLMDTSGGSRSSTTPPREPAVRAPQPTVAEKPV